VALKSALRIGVFGGAFDPPHKAHVALAVAALTQLKLDALHIVPTGKAWHKARALTPAVHRLAMAQLAFAPLALAVIDPQEINRDGPSFTIDTLETLASDHPGVQLHLILGTDQFATLKSWHRWQDILGKAIICIAIRPGMTRAESDPELEALASRGVLTLQLPLMPLSATDIRRQIAGLGDSPQALDHLVPEPVARYIEHHKLYLSR
jgi:nicotinate-nucleotide adenylyltransferase